MKIKIPFKTKKNKNSKIKFKKWYSKPQFLVFVLLFASIGSYFIYKSFAATTDILLVTANDLVSQSDQIVIQKHVNRPHAHSLDDLQEYYAPDFMLYGDGRLICGTPGSATLKTAIMSRPEVLALFENIKLSGFGKLDRIYADTDNKSENAHRGTVIAVNFNQGAKTVRYYGPTIAKPTSFSQTEALLSARCALAVQAFTPESLQVGFKKTSGIATPWNQAVLTFPRLSNSLEYVSMEGLQAKQMLALMGGETQKLLRSPTGVVYEVRIYPNLPAHDAPVELNVNKVVVHKNNPFSSKVYADATRTHHAGNQFIVLWHHAKDDPISDDSANLGEYAESINAFYIKAVGQATRMLGPEIVTGKYNGSTYKYCSYSNCSSEVREDGMFDKFHEEYDNYRYADAVLIFTDLSVDSRTCNGIGTLGNIPAIGAVFNSDECSKNKSKKSGAHELGHNFGLEHTFNDTVMTQRGDGNDTCDKDFDLKCKLDKNQAQSLKYSSYFVEPESTAKSLADQNPLGPQKGTRIDF